MKIIALLPFKNEEWVLREYIASMKKVTDHIIAYDDKSIDSSRALLEESGATIISEDYKEKSGWAEFSIRERLLKEGRKAGGTHFVCLDADEIFSDTFTDHAHELIASLSPGQCLWLDWVNLYKNKETERVDGVYKHINKNFIFADEPTLTFDYAFLGVSRTPGDPLNRVVADRSKGSVIHFQFLNMERALMKRAWYMCSELIKGDRHPLRINAMYDIQKEKKGTKTRHLTKAEAFTLVDPKITDYSIDTDWRYDELKEWFAKYGLEYFEPLDIWDTPHLALLFRDAVGRPPHPKTIPSFLLQLNDIKNKAKVSLQKLFFSIRN